MRRGERGQASMVLIVAVPALLVAALIIITIVGDGMVKRTETSTAADAAALAAAEGWRTYVADVLADADGRAPDEALARVHDLLTTDAALLGGGRIAARARELAQANDAQLTGLSVRRTSRGLEFGVTTRNVDTVAQSSIRPTSHAVALVEITGGACWRGAHLGLLHDGDCLDWAALKDVLTPEPPSDPGGGAGGPTPSATPTPRASFVTFRADTRLVA